MTGNESYRENRTCDLEIENPMRQLPK